MTKLEQINKSIPILVMARVDNAIARHSLAHNDGMYRHLQHYHQTQIDNAIEELNRPWCELIRDIKALAFTPGAW